MAKTHDHRNGIEQWLAVGGGWRLAVGGPWRLSLTKKIGVLKGDNKKASGTPTETNFHGDALCFMAKTHDHRNGIEQWLAVGGGWRLAVGGPWRLSLTKKIGVLKGDNKKASGTPTETNFHGDARCFLVKTWAQKQC